MPNKILKYGIEKNERNINDMKSIVSIFFHELRCLIIQECLFGMLKCCFMRNHAYHLKQKNSIINKKSNNFSDGEKKYHRLKELTGRGHRRSMALNQRIVSTR